jgi:hypothetical protein
MTMIEGISFGSITIDGTTYTSDLIRFPDGRVVEPWWRSTGHRLTLDDITDLVAAAPEVIVAGCGVSGMMKPEPGLSDALAERGIAFYAAPNKEAAERFNRLCGVKKAAACFHLTC